MPSNSARVEVVGVARAAAVHRGAVDAQEVVEPLAALVADDLNAALASALDVLSHLVLVVAPQLVGAPARGRGPRCRRRDALARVWRELVGEQRQAHELRDRHRHRAPNRRSRSRTRLRRRRRSRRCETGRRIRTASRCRCGPRLRSAAAGTGRGSSRPAVSANAASGAIGVGGEQRDVGRVGEDLAALPARVQPLPALTVGGIARRPRSPVPARSRQPVELGDQRRERAGVGLMVDRAG